MLARSGVIYIYKAPIPYIPPVQAEPPVAAIEPKTAVVPEPTTYNLQPTTVVPEPVHPVPVTPKILNQVQDDKKGIPFRRYIGMAMLIVAAAGIVFPFLPQARLESAFLAQKVEKRVDMMVKPTVALPPSVPFAFSPLTGPDGQEIVPINTDFSIIVPKLGINAAVVASVDPLDAKDYMAALAQGVAHSKTSYFPDQDGAIYLFSHSTNYEWFVKDLNAIFYNLKNLEDNDTIVVYYKGKRYTYSYKSREVVKANDISYLLPVTGKKQLILQTCWPPGTTTSRLLIFADLLEVDGKTL